MHAKHLLPITLATALIGCVSSGRYDDLKKQHDAARAKVAAGQAEIDTLKQAVATEQTASAQLRAELTAAQTEHAQLEARRAALATENDSLLSELQALSKDRSKLEQTRDKLKESLAALAERKAEVERRAAEFRAMLERFKNLIDSGTLRVRMVDGRMVLALPSDVLFDSGSAKLSKGGKAAVQQVGAALATMTDRRFQVEGHTDNVPIKNELFASNWELSAGRALGVVHALFAAGMQGAALSAGGYGEFHPVMTNKSPQGRTENRRIEIVLLPDLSTVPELQELERQVAK